MIHHRPIVKTALFCFLLITGFSFNNISQAQDGQALFRSNCNSCHTLHKDLTGPALANFTDRGPWSDRQKVYDWVHNPVAFMAKDPYTQGLKQQYGSVMQAFPNLSNEDIDAITEYIIKASATPAPGAAGGSNPTAEQTKESDSTLLYGILTLILALIALILLQVNSNLKKL